MEDPRCHPPSVFFLNVFVTQPDFCGPRERDWQGGSPSEPGIDACKSSSLVLAQPQEEASSRLQTLGCQRNQHFEISDRAHGCIVELSGGNGGDQFFQAFSADCDLGEATDAGSFLQEGSLFGDGLQQSDGNLRKDDFEGEPGKSGAAADVKQGAVGLSMAGKEEAFAKMPGNALCWVADGGQVDFLVPAEQQMEVGECLADLGWSEIEAKRSQKLAEARIVEHRGDCKVSLLCAQGPLVPWMVCGPCFTWNVRQSKAR